MQTKTNPHKPLLVLHHCSLTTLIFITSWTHNSASHLIVCSLEITQWPSQYRQVQHWLTQTALYISFHLSTLVCQAKKYLCLVGPVPAVSIHTITDITLLDLVFLFWSITLWGIFNKVFCPETTLYCNKRERVVMPKCGWHVHTSKDTGKCSPFYISYFSGIQLVNNYHKHNDKSWKKESISLPQNE